MKGLRSSLSEDVVVAGRDKLSRFDVSTRVHSDLGRLYLCSLAPSVRSLETVPLHMEKS